MLETKSRFEILIDRWVSWAELARTRKVPRWQRLVPRLTVRWLALLLPFMLVVSSFGVQEWNEFFGPGSCHFTIGASGAGQNKVGLVDPLALMYPNGGFVRNIESASKLAGYSFDYFSPGTLSLDTFANLPTGGYSILLLRTHGGASIDSPQVAMTTSEPYSSYVHVADQMNDRLAEVEVDGSFYFGLTHQFISQRMCGRFPNTVVLAMGCHTMDNDELAKAFVQRGAIAFVGWKGVVDAGLTDTVFSKLVSLLLTNHSIGEAVQEVTQSFGLSGGGPVLSFYST